LNKKARARAHQSLSKLRTINKRERLRQQRRGAIRTAHIRLRQIHRPRRPKAKLARSEVSGKFYREDERLASGVSGQSGHRSEFIFCHETRQPILPSEAERCEATGKFVRPGVLEACAATTKRVLPSQLEPSMVSGARVLRTMLVESSISNARFLESEAVRSAYQKFCAPVEATRCEWSGDLIHPDDVRTCALLGLRVHFSTFAIAPTGFRSWQTY
jgi:hypothetical protein